MTVDLLAGWWVHTTTVTRRTGTGARGDIYDTPADLTGFVDDANKLITDAAGKQVVSSARVFYPAGTVVPLGSRVTLTGPFLDRTSTVIAVSVHDAGTVDVPAHVEVALQ